MIYQTELWYVPSPELELITDDQTRFLVDLGWIAYGILILIVVANLFAGCGIQRYGYRISLAFFLSLFPLAVLWVSSYVYRSIIGESIAYGESKFLLLSATPYVRILLGGVFSAYCLVALLLLAAKRYKCHKGQHQ